MLDPITFAGNILSSVWNTAQTLVSNAGIVVSVRVVNKDIDMTISGFENTRPYAEALPTLVLYTELKNFEFDIVEYEVKIATVEPQNIVLVGSRYPSGVCIAIGIANACDMHQTEAMLRDVHIKLAKDNNEYIL